MRRGGRPRNGEIQSKIEDKEMLRAKVVEQSAFDESQAVRAFSKPDFTQVPMALIRRVAKRYGLGEINYGRDNWKKGGPEFLHDCVNHAIEHLILYANGDMKEDHLGAVGWFAACMAWHEEQGSFKNINELNEAASEARRRRHMEGIMNAARPERVVIRRRRRK